MSLSEFEEGLREPVKWTKSYHDEVGALTLEQLDELFEMVKEGLILGGCSMNERLFPVRSVR